MFLNRIIPVLQLDGRRLFKTQKFTNPVYIGDPVNVVQILNKKGVNELIILNISKDRFNRNVNDDLLKEIASECFMPVSYGGGISRLNDIEKVLAFGFEKIVINTYGLNNPNFLKDAVSEFGSSTVVCSIDYKIIEGQRIVFTNGGVDKHDKRFEDVIRQVADQGVGEIILTDIARDGTFQGYDIDVLQLLKKQIGIPIIINGGANSLDDMVNAIDAGAQAVAAGSFFSLRLPHRAVLISYPNESLINEVFYGRTKSL